MRNDLYGYLTVLRAERDIESCICINTEGMEDDEFEKLVDDMESFGYGFEGITRNGPYYITAVFN